MSPSSSRGSTVLNVAAVTVLSGLVAYAIYFDYRRRNDSDFRKQLRKEKKKVTKQTQQAQVTTATDNDLEGLTPADIKEALLKIQSEELPPSAGEKEAYFMMQLQVADQLIAKGHNLSAAMAYFRAMRVYPAPVELMMMLQSTAPQPVFKIFLELVNADVAVKVSGYYDSFPPKRMNVSIQHSTDQTTRPPKKILVAAKDFAAGDIIYKESPLVAALDHDLEGQGIHCSYCFRAIQKGMAIVPESDKLGSVFCSKDCQVKANLGWHNMLFGTDSVLPPDMDQGMTNSVENRRKASNGYVEWINTKGKGKQANVLAGRFVAKQIANGIMDLSSTDNGGPLSVELKQLTDGKTQYTLGDHIERLRFIGGDADEEEVKLLREVLAAGLPGVESSVTDETYAIMVAKMAYNAMGVCPGGGRKDRPASEARPEEQERTRTPYGTAHQLGSGFYLVSSYIAHSCDPSVRPSFSAGTNELQIVATRAIKKGEGLTMAYVDVTQHGEESVKEARQRRRYELARGWKFKCECTRCLSEAVAEIDKEEADAALGVKGDESKVESVTRHEHSAAAGLSTAFMGPD